MNTLFLTVFRKLNRKLFEVQRRFTVRGRKQTFVHGSLFFQEFGEWTYELNNSFTKLAAAMAATDLRVGEKVREFLGHGSHSKDSPDFIGKFRTVL